jgi:hypothetical protein
VSDNRRYRKFTVQQKTKIVLASLRRMSRLSWIFVTAVLEWMISDGGRGDLRRRGR